MLNQTGIKQRSYGNVDQILFATQYQVSVGIVVDSTGVTAGADGKKILKAGTPVSGDLTKRETAFKKIAEVVAKNGETSTTTQPVAEGVLLHDVDVTSGEGNATLLLFGFVNLNRLDAATKALITDDVKADLTMIKFIAG